MKKHFMIDIETTGIDPSTEELLQIGVLELTFGDDEYWHPGRSLELTQHTGRTPQGDFAKEHMAALYEKCRNQAWAPPEHFRAGLLQFFKDCGEHSPNVYLMGWNASNFDIPFLTHHRYLVPSSYAIGPDGKDVMVGDFHYRIYELGGAVSLAQNAFGYSDRSALLSDARLAFQMQMPPGKEHDALYDCYAQTQLINGLIRLTRNPVLWRGR